MTNAAIPISGPFFDVSKDPDGAYVIRQAKTEPLQQLDLPKGQLSFGDWVFSELISFSGTINTETLDLDLYLKFAVVKVHHWNQILTRPLVIKSYFGTFTFSITNLTNEHQLWGYREVSGQLIEEAELARWPAA